MIILGIISHPWDRRTCEQTEASLRAGRGGAS